MEYTVQKLGRLAGISTRTLRYYDQIGLLKPARISSSGYRIYGREEVDLLQQIMFFKELGFELEKIREIISSPIFDQAEALLEHRKRLVERRRQLDLLIANVDKSIARQEGRIEMTDKEKFEGFKRQLIDENEQKYGQEVRAKFGKEEVEKSNRKLMGLTQEQYDKMTKLSQDILDTLQAAMETKDPAGELAQKAADLHRQWISYFWSEYNKDAHAGLAQMYVDDARFTAYYDAQKPGVAKFLRDAILIYTGKN